MKQLVRILLCCLTVSGVENRPPSVPAKEFTGSGAYAALEFWTRSRSYPFNDIPPDKYYKAYATARQTLKEDRRLPESLTPWEFIGPDNFSGRIISIAINPLNPNTIYIGSASGGLWRTHSGGAGGDWQRITTGYPVLGVGAVAIDPTDTNVVYIGTGEVYRYQGALRGIVIRTTRGSYGMGILKTTDGGSTWTKSLDWSYNQERGVQKIRFNPLNHRSLWAATTEGIYKSTDAGGSWSGVNNTLMAMDIVPNTADTNTVMASCGNFSTLADPPAILRTTDGGTNWADITFTFFSGKTLLEPYPPNPNVVYASVSDSTTDPASLWKTTNFGTTWTLLNNSLSSAPQGWYCSFVAVQPADSTKILYGTNALVRSTNGGVSFNQLLVSVDYHDYAHHPTDPNTLYVVADYGIYRTTDFGATFSAFGDLNPGLHITQFYNGCSNSVTDSNMAVGPIQDLGAPIYAGGLSWGPRKGGVESGWTTIDPASDSLIYAASGDVYLFESTDRGVTTHTDSYPFSGRAAWDNPCVISPSQPHRIYYGLTTIYSSDNSGATWTSLGTLDGNPALSMAVAATNADTLYVGTAAYATITHIYRTTNGGGVWTDVTDTLPDRYPTDIAVDPANSAVVYVTMGGFGSGHVFKSTDAGGSWSNMTGTLPDIPTTAVFVDPLNSSHVFVGNDLGAYISTDGGVSWSAFSVGLPEAVVVSDLFYSPSNRMLRLATYGSGMYQRRLPDVVPNLSLTSPNGGDSLEAGTVHSIIWTGDFLTSVNLEYTTDNGGTWHIIADSVPGAAAAYSWTVPFVRTGAGRVRVTSTSNGSLHDQSDTTFTIFFNGTLFAVDRGWNLVSVPESVQNYLASALFPTASSPAYAFEGSYVTKDTLENGTGYWLRFESGQSLGIGGTAITGDSINVVAGWNLIGSLSAPIPASSIGSDPPGLVTSELFGYNGRYVVVDTLMPAHGYWIKTSQGGTLALTSTPAIVPASRIRIVHTDEMPPSPPEGPSGPQSQAPANFELLHNYPNPFTSSTEIGFRIPGLIPGDGGPGQKRSEGPGSTIGAATGNPSMRPEPGRVSIRVYDILGRVVATLVDERKNPGEYHVHWNAAGMPSGIYFVSMKAGSFATMERVLLVR